MGYQALLFCPDEKLARVVTQVLSDLEFSVETATEPFAAVKKLMAQHFDAVVVDCDNEQNATLLFKSARNSSSNQSSLAVAVVEGQAGVAKAFRIGANLVLTKPINIEQAKGTLRVARGLLRKGADAAKAAPSAPVAPAPAAVPPISSTKLTSIFASAPPASATGQAPKRQALMPSSESLRESVMVPSSNALSAQETEPDTILESDETEVLEVPPPPVMKPAPVASAAPAPTA